MDRKAACTLATYAMTGVLRGRFTAGAREDVAVLGELASAVSTELVAKTAVVARAHGRSKTLPAVLVATLAARDVSMMERVFARVIDDGPSLLTFCDAVRSGSLGRKSFGSAPRRAIRNWFSSRSPEAIFRQSIGRSPSMSDVIKMVRPAPRVASGNDEGESDAVREALYGYLVGKNVDRSLLPPLARSLEDFKRLDAPKGPVPDLPLEMLTALPLRTPHWTELAKTMTFSQLRQHLSTLLRHGVLSDMAIAESVAERLSDPRAIARAKAKPYALYTTLRAVQAHAPHVIVRALEDAVELAFGNVPLIDGGVTVMVDGSGSMLGPLAGARRSASNALRCMDVAGLVAGAYRSMKGDRLTIAVSDYEATTMNADVLVDLQPKHDARVDERDDVLYVAGFSDEVFDVIAAFARGDLDGERWLALIEETNI
jgi:60 kDa SS-A/Ro ribonucleoprotein